MLKRKVGQKVYINPYLNATGIIIDSKETTQPFNLSWDYLVKFTEPIIMGAGIQEEEYFTEDELDRLFMNWQRVKCN